MWLAFSAFQFSPLWIHHSTWTATVQRPNSLGILWLVTSQMPKLLDALAQVLLSGSQRRCISSKFCIFLYFLTLSWLIAEKSMEPWTVAKIDLIKVALCSVLTAHYWIGNCPFHQPLCSHQLNLTGLTSSPRKPLEKHQVWGLCCLMEEKLNTSPLLGFCPLEIKMWTWHWPMVRSGHVCRLKFCF